ncbi:MAG: hypothetical protein IKJ01_04215 [Lachnospiraceae bacterium]|nr:hypothetical protein [Lachnospiraceae bacterium]
MTHKELVAKARETKSAEELMELAKAEGMELTEEYYAMLNSESGELSEKELDKVFGGINIPKIDKVFGGIDIPKSDRTAKVTGLRFGEKVPTWTTRQ